MRHFIVLLVLAGMAVGSIASEKENVDILNRLYSYTNAELEKACESMDNSYAPGLTDGAYVALGGRTYYYKSRCYDELAARTEDIKYCALVKQRRALLDDGSGTSPKTCEARVQQLLLAHTEARKSASRHKDAVKNVHRIQSVSVETLSSGDFKVTISTQGLDHGSYSLDIERLYPSKALTAWTFSIKTPQTVQSIVLKRDDVIAGIKLPNIVSLGIHLNYTLPDGTPYMSSIGNATLRIEH